MRAPGDGPSPVVPEPRDFGGSEVPDEIAPIEAPFAMPDLERPSFPDREFDVREYGATAGREERDTEAIADAIEACHEAGGGRVVIPEGEWLTGPIHLESHVDLHVAEGAYVHFVEDLDAYLPTVRVRHEGVEAENYSPLIYAPHVENVAITGGGTFDGKWPFWEAWALDAQGDVHHGDRAAAAARPLEEREFGKGAGMEGMRPNFVVPWHAEDVLIEGPTFKDGPMWNVNPVYCENVIVRDVTVESHDTHNGDGIVPDSSKGVLIEYVDLRTSDDAVVIKSGFNEDGRRIDVPTRKVVVRNYTAKDVRTGSGGIVFGSETAGGIHDVYVHDAYFENTHRGIRFKTAPERGSYVTDVHVERVRMHDVERPAMNFNLHYDDPADDAYYAAPRVRNIHVSDVLADGAAAAFDGRGLEDEPIRNLAIEDAVFRNVEEGIGLRLFDGVTLSGVAVETAGTPLRLREVHDAHLEDLSLAGEEPHLVVEDCEGVTLDGEPVDGG